LPDNGCLKSCRYGKVQFFWILKLFAKPLTLKCKKSTYNGASGISDTGLIFFSKLVFDKNLFRTMPYREVISLICATSKGFKEDKNEKCPENSGHSNVVIRIGFEPMTYCLEGSCSIQLSYRTLNSRQK
jgi:hypothetical protein